MEATGAAQPVRHAQLRAAVVGTRQRRVLRRGREEGHGILDMPIRRRFGVSGPRPSHNAGLLAGRRGSGATLCIRRGEGMLDTRAGHTAQIMLARGER